MTSSAGMYETTMTSSRSVCIVDIRTTPSHTKDRSTKAMGFRIRFLTLV